MTDSKTYWALKRREFERDGVGAQRPARVRARARRRLPAATYRQLQQRAKDLGIPANQTREDLEAAIANPPALSVEAPPEETPAITEAEDEEEVVEDVEGEEEVE